MTHENFVIPEGLMDRVRDELKTKNHDAIANQVWLNHPAELDAPLIVGTGGGCEAYMVDVPCTDQNILIVWTDEGGCDLPELDSWMVSVQIGEQISEDPLLALSHTHVNVADTARKAAIDTFNEAGEVEFDTENAPVKRVADGWKVQCWVWVDAESAGMEHLDDEADEDNVEIGYIAAVEHDHITFEDAKASLGDGSGAFVSGWAPMTDEEVTDYDTKACAAQAMRNAS